MTAKTTKAKPWISGFCGPGNDAESHARCDEHPRADGKACGCPHHVERTNPIEGGEKERDPHTLPAQPLPADLAGFHDDVDEVAYHAHRGSLSHSGAKLLLRSPAHYRYALDHPVHKNVFDFGSAAHALVLGVGVEIVVHEYDAEKVKSPKATNAWKAEQDEVRGRGAVLLLPDEFATVQAMADELSAHRLAMRLLSEGKPEVSAFALDEPTGVLRRGRFDWLGSTILTDYKTAVSSDPAAFVKVAVNLGYHSQHAWYLDLAADLGHPAQAFAFVVQEKDPPYVVTVIELPAELVDIGRRRNRTALERFRDCTAADLWPGYMPDDDFATPPAPSWALREDAA